MTKDWVEWHRGYDEPTSSLARRLEVVQRDLQQALTDARPGDAGELRLISICAGDGRDVLPTLAAQDGAGPIRALLVELDPSLARRARETAAEFSLSAVEVHTSDAGVTDSYTEIAPAHIVLACGVFGNITSRDVRQTIATLRRLLADGGIVIWTRGRQDDGTDPSIAIREWFTEHGFTELSFTAPADARFRVGMHRLDRPSADPIRPGTRMFSFIRSDRAACPRDLNVPASPSPLPADRQRAVPRGKGVARSSGGSAWPDRGVLAGGEPPGAVPPDEDVEGHLGERAADVR